MITLALDLAGTTGYAVAWRGELIKVGTANLARNLTGPRNPLPAHRLWRRLCRWGQQWLITKIVFEETFARGAARYRLDSLQHTVVLWCLDQQIAWERVSPSRWKKACLGNGFVSRQQYLNAAIRRWPYVDLWDDNQAAACWLLAYVGAVE